jgi:hypothetical protein
VTRKGGVRERIISSRERRDHREEDKKVRKAEGNFLRGLCGLQRSPVAGTSGREEKHVSRRERRDHREEHKKVRKAEGNFLRGLCGLQRSPVAGTSGREEKNYLTQSREVSPPSEGPQRDNQGGVVSSSRGGTSGTMDSSNFRASAREGAFLMRSFKATAASL